MELHIYKNQAVKQVTQKDQRPFCWKIQQRALGPGESAAGDTYVFMRIHPKNCCIFPLKVAAALLSGLRKDAVGT